MFGIGTTEVLLILVVALLVIGPSKLPDVARTLGKGMAEFRRMSSDVKRTIDFEAQRADMERDTSQADASHGGQSAPEQSPESPDAEPEDAKRAADFSSLQEPSSDKGTSGSEADGEYTSVADNDPRSTRNE